MGSLWRWWAATPESGGTRVHPCFILTVIDNYRFAIAKSVAKLFSNYLDLKLNLATDIRL